jgi:hypothetical protein
MKQEDKCSCGNLIYYFFEHALNCPLNPIRAAVIEEENLQEHCDRCVPDKCCHCCDHFEEEKK